MVSRAVTSFYIFCVSRSSHPFFLGRKASISKKAFGRVFIFSLMSHRVFASSSNSPVLHLMDDISAVLYYLHHTIVCVYWGRPTLSQSLCVHVCVSGPDVTFLLVYVNIHFCISILNPCTVRWWALEPIPADLCICLCVNLLFHEPGDLFESFALTGNGGRAIVL